MTPLNIAIRKIFRKGEHSLTRILSLAAGLAFGLLLLSEVFYYYSFDSFYPDADRIYVVYENFKSDKSSDVLDEYGRVSGAIAPALKSEVPGIEAASRLNNIGSSVFYTDDNKSYKGDFSLADENVFDVLPRRMIFGNPKEILKGQMNCMISSEIAEMIGGEVIGKMIELKEFPGRKLTIAGVFEALPENTNYKYDILISMVSTSKFTWDGTNNWLGNDRYYVCVKLEPGTDPEKLGPAVRKMQEVHQDIIHLEAVQEGMVLKYSFKPIQKVHIDSVKEMIVLLSAIAIAVLAVSLLNYILLTLSALVGRAKTSAIYKTYGAKPSNIQLMIFYETAILFIISLLVAFMIITVVQPLVEAQIGHHLSSTLNPYVVWPLIICMVFLLLIISYFPGRFFAGIPVASVFQDYPQKGNRWKLALLSFQFAGTTFILTMLVIVILQYDRLRNSDHGYSAEGVFYGSTSGMPGSKLATVLNELKAIPQVEIVGLGSAVPTEGAPGNNVSLPDSEKELFNIADFYWIDENYLSILNIPVVEGEGFLKESCIPNDFIVSRKCSDMILINSGWKDGVTGKQISLSEHGVHTIRGIFPDFIVGGMADPDQRPIMFSYLPDDKFQERIEENPSYSCYVIARTYKGAEADFMKRMTGVLNSALPHQDAVVRSLENEKINLYSSEKGFRTTMFAGNIIILLITIIGLLGYAVTEASRRSKELAIRKINGARISDIIVIFIKDLMYVAIPATIAGSAGALFAGQKWMENFASRIDLHWSIFVFCSLFVLLLIVLVSVLNYVIIANKNPVEALKHE
jgi:putative ABC transport system permease protein